MTLPDRFVFMKVGMHAGEEWESILARKRAEIAKRGFCFWGYGGSTCHPLTQVQPFAKTALERNGSIYLLMQTMDSKADPDLLPATEYSADGVNWSEIPEGITVTGSRYAIVLEEIADDELMLPLSGYAVALGNSRGKVAADYIKGRVDKACLEAAGSPNPGEGAVGITHRAKMKDPYAVLLRGRRRS